jgi:integrase
LGTLLGPEDPAQYSTETLETCYLQALQNLKDDEASRGLRDQVAWAFREFHRFLQVRYQAEPITEPRLLGLWKGLVPVDANVLSPEEFTRVLDYLDRQLPPAVPLRLRQLTKLLAILGFKGGLRRAEVRGLSLEDFLGLEPGAAELFIRPSEYRRLKTKSATRRLPLQILLTAEELEALRAWVRMRLREGQPGETTLLFAIPELGLWQVPDSVFALLHEALRTVTGDPSMRYQG